MKPNFHFYLFLILATKFMGTVSTTLQGKKSDSLAFRKQSYNNHIVCFIGAMDEKSKTGDFQKYEGRT